VTLSVAGAAEILGPRTTNAEAGIASFVPARGSGGAFDLRAFSGDRTATPSRKR
jgi:hypothetical protein